MHNITFKKLVFSNFMSYGDIPNTVDFINGLTYLNAANGYGKSAIIEALTFALFGNSYRGGNIADLKNTENVHSEMKTALDFSVDNGKEVHEYHIERNLKPKAKSPTFKLFIDNVEQSKKAGLGQSGFENEILGFDFKLFKYVIALNSQETTPFVEMPVPKKRELLEQVISVSTEKWKKFNNKALSDASMNFDTASKSVERIINDITYMGNMIETLKSQKKNEVESLVKQQQEKIDARPELSDKCTSLKRELDIVNAEYTTARENLDNINAASSELNRTYTEIDTYKHCMQIVSDIENEKNNLNTLNDQLNIVNTEAMKFNHESLEDRINVLSAEINSCNTDISNSELTISTNNTEINRIERQKQKIQADADEQMKLSDSQQVGVPCPTCGKPSTEEDVAKVKAAIGKVIDGLRAQWVEENNRVKELKSLNGQKNDFIAKLRDEITSKTVEYDNVKARLDEYNLYVTSNVSPISFAIQDSTKRIAGMKAQLAKYSDNTDVIIDRINKLCTRRDELISITSSAETVTAAFNEAADRLRNANDVYNGAYRELQYLDSEITNLSSAIEEARKEENDESLQIAISRMNELNADLDNAKNEVTTYSEKIELCKYITYLCSDDGLKSYIIKLFVPYFNNAVEDNLRRFNLPFHFVFDNTMDYTYSSSIGSAPVYDMLSDGQKRKVGFAIAMAFCDFVFTIANFRINCMFLDEILDISTDDYALRDMVGLVRARTQKTPVIFAVTHRAKIIQDLFDYKLNIHHNGMFSSIGTRDNVSANVNSAIE